MGMTKIEESAVIDRPAELIWKFMADFTEAPRREHSVLEAMQVSSELLGVGSIDTVSGNRAWWNSGNVRHI
jgi:uncharacterized membrane protein